MATLVEGEAPPAPAAPPPDPTHAVTSAGSHGGTGAHLLRFALANVRRRPERFALSTVGIALAVTAVIVVRTVAAGYAGHGSTSLDDVLRGAPLWVVDAAGVRYDPDLAVLVPQPGGAAAPDLTTPAGWTATRQVGGVWTAPGGARVALFGRDDVPADGALLTRAAAARLGVTAGGSLTLGSASLQVSVPDPGRWGLPTDPDAVAVLAPSAAVTAALGSPAGWWTVRPPDSDAARKDLGTALAATTGLPSTTDPARTPSGTALIYDTVGGSSTTTFAQRFSAVFSSKVTSSTLGLVSVVGLLLGFVIAVSSFLAAVQERRREFGIMSSIGLADEVLYFFLVESALVFVAAYALGALVAGAAVALVVPSIATLAGWAQASGIVAAYLPAMAIVGALVPVHRLLQQRPVALLRDDA